MTSTNHRGNVATVLACPTCGRSTDAHAARFCGGCGELLRPRGSGPAEVALAPDPAAAPVERLDDPSPRRRIVAVVVVAAVLALAVTAVLREPVEVVTADGLGTASGRTSNLAVTDLSTEHWRVALYPRPQEGSGGWVSAAASADGNRLMTAGSRTTTVDLSTGEVLGTLPPIAGTPVLRDGRLVVAIRDRFVAVDPTDGTVTALLRLDRDVAAQPVFPHPVDDGWLVLGEDGVSSVASDGTVRWSAQPSLESQFRFTVEGDAVVVSDWAGNVAALDLAEGSLRWRNDRITGQRGPDTVPLTADGLIFGIEVSQEPEGRGRPSTGIPTARDVATGEIVWQTQGPLAAALIGVRDGVLFVATQLDPRPIQRIDVASGRLLDPVGYADSLNPPGIALMGPSGSLLVGAPGGGLRAVDERTGDVRWETERGEVWGSVVVEDLVLLNGPGGIQVVDGVDGSLVQHLPGTASGPPSGIAVSGRTAMVVPGLAVDVADGRARIDRPSAEWWSPTVAVPGGFVLPTSDGTTVVDVNGAQRPDLVDLAPGYGREIVAVVGDHIVVVDHTAEDAALELLDRDGRPVGERLEGQQLYRPVVVGDLVIGQRWRPGTGGSDGLVAVRVGEGGLELVWEARPAGGVLLAEEGALYEVTALTVARRDLQDGSVATTALLPQTLDTRQVALVSGALLAAVDDVLLAVEPGTGSLLWERDLESPITAGPRTAGEVVAVGTETGDVVLLDLAGAVIASRDAADAPVRDVVTAHGLVLVVTDGHAFALGPETLPGRTTQREPSDIGTVDVPVP